MPFDLSTVHGYSISYSIQLCGSASICSVIYTNNSLFFGVCWYFRALLFDLISIFSQMSKLIMVKSSKTVPVSVDDNLKGHTLFRAFVQFHVDITRYGLFFCRNIAINNLHSLAPFFIQPHWSFRFIEHFGDIMNGIILVTFFISVLWICSSIFQIHAVRALFEYVDYFSVFVFSLLLHHFRLEPFNHDVCAVARYYDNDCDCSNHFHHVLLWTYGDHRLWNGCHFHCQRTMVSVPN